MGSLGGEPGGDVGCLVAGAGNVVRGYRAPGRGGGGGGGAPLARAGGRGVLGAPGASPGLFFAAGAGLLYLLSPFPLLAAVPCPSRVTRFQKPWASADFQVSSCPSQETELQTP